MKPRPWRLASVQSLVGLVISKNAKVGATVSCSLAALKALSCVEDHEKSFLLLRRGLSGASREEIVLVEADSWFANPKKERRLFGVKKLVMVSVMDLSTWYPLLES